MSDQIRIAELDPEPVKYCVKCLSLKVSYEEISDTEYCGDCGCVDIAECPFDEWERKYEARYGHKLVEKGTDPRKHPIYQMSLSELKKKIYNSPNWREALGCIYHKIPMGYSKLDCILLVFDRIIRENKVDEFKIALTKVKL